MASEGRPNKRARAQMGTADNNTRPKKSKRDALGWGSSATNQPGKRRKRVKTRSHLRPLEEKQELHAYQCLGVSKATDMLVDLPASVTREFDAVASQFSQQVPAPHVTMCAPIVLKNNDYVVVYETGAGKISHYTQDRRLLRVLKGDMNKVAVYEDTSNQDFTLVATGDIQADEPIAAAVGVLRRESDFEREYTDVACVAQVETFTIRKELLQHLGARIPENLVVQCTDTANATKFLNDCHWNGYHVAVPPNVAAFFVFCVPTAVPYIVFFATRNIKEGDELFADCGTAEWEVSFKRDLTNQALAARAIYAYKQVVEERIISCLGGRNNTSLSTGRGDNEGVFTPRFRAVQLQEAFNVCRCKYSHHCELGLSDDTLHQLRQLSIPPSKDSRFLQLLDGKFDSKLQVVEILDPEHPCRLYTVPDSTAYGVCAKRRVRQGEAVCTYAGLLIEEARFYDTAQDMDHVYAFKICGDVLRKHGYQGPPLVVVAMSCGSIGRFVNGTFGHMTDANVEVVEVWDAGRRIPVLVFKALRTIERGEELVLDYGMNYWRIMTRHIMNDLVEWCSDAVECLKNYHRLFSRAGKQIPPLPCDDRAANGWLDFVPSRDS